MRMGPFGKGRLGRDKKGHVQTKLQGIAAEIKQPIYACRLDWRLQPGPSKWGKARLVSPWHPWRLAHQQ